MFYVGSYITSAFTKFLDSWVILISSPDGSTLHIHSRIVSNSDMCCSHLIYLHHLRPISRYYHLFFLIIEAGYDCDIVVLVVQT